MTCISNVLSGLFSCSTKFGNSCFYRTLQSPEVYTCIFLHLLPLALEPHLTSPFHKFHGPDSGHHWTWSRSLLVSLLYNGPSHMIMLRSCHSSVGLYNSTGTWISAASHPEGYLLSSLSLSNTKYFYQIEMRSLQHGTCSSSQHKTVLPDHPVM
jgi:hypothetical protein